MAKNITLNSTNVIGQNNNSYKKEFINGDLEIDDGEGIFVDKLIFPNSVCNVSSSLGNNVFAYGFTGYQFEGSTNGNIEFAVNTTVVNGNVLSLNISSGFLYIGFVIEIVGLSTPTPIIVTDIPITEVNYILATVTINQNISVTAGAIGDGYIVGNKIIWQSPSQFPTPSAPVNVPQKGALLVDFKWVDKDGNDVISGNNTYITNVRAQNNINENNIYELTLNKSIPYEARVSQYTYTPGTGTYIYPVTLADGFYDINGLNKAFQQTLYNNGHYFHDLATGVSGKINNTIYYPVTLSNSLPDYSFKNTVTQVVSADLIEQTYGTGATINTNYVINPNFDNLLILTDNSSGVYRNIHGWVQNIISVGNGIIGIGRGTNVNVSITPPSNVIQYVFFRSLSTLSNMSISTSQQFYLNAGTYTLSANVYKRLTGGGDTLTFTLSGGAGVVMTVSGAVWTTPSITLTQAVSGFVDLTINFQSTNPSQPNTCALSTIVITPTTVSQRPIGTLWSNTYPTIPDRPFIIFPNFFQQSVGTLQGTTYKYELVNPKYSIGNYLCSNSDPDFNFTSSSVDPFNGNIYSSLRGFGIPAFGLSMNPFYGIIIKCNLVRNGATNQSNQTISFPITYPFGSNNYYEGDKRDVMPLEKGRYNSITFELCDQNGNTITFLDNNVLMNFIVGKIIHF
jgi:hypothetical protein